MSKLRKFKKDFKKYTLMTIPTIALMASFTGCSNEYVEEVPLAECTDLVDDMSFTDENYKMLYLNYSDITDDDLDKIPSYIEELSFYDCYFIKDLSRLPEICPNLKYLYISNCPCITNFDFVYKFNSLESFKIHDEAFITGDLALYLDSKGIRHNIGDKELEMAHKVDKIASNLFTDGMSDEEKIKAVSMYIMDNYEYDELFTDVSNMSPLETMLYKKRAVCAGYAYFATVLLRKGNVDAYQVMNNKHMWNLIKEDDKYYYLDTTFVDGNNFDFIVKKCEHAPGYMSDPKATNLTTMSKYDAGIDTVLIPKAMVEDIEKGEELETL